MNSPPCRGCKGWVPVVSPLSRESQALNFPFGSQTALTTATGFRRAAENKKERYH